MLGHTEAVFDVPEFVVAADHFFRFHDCDRYVCDVALEPDQLQGSVVSGFVKHIFCAVSCDESGHAGGFLATHHSEGFVLLLGESMGVAHSAFGAVLPDGTPSEVIAGCPDGFCGHDGVVDGLECLGCGVAAWCAGIDDGAIVEVVAAPGEPLHEVVRCGAGA